MLSSEGRPFPCLRPGRGYDQIMASGETYTGPACRKCGKMKRYVSDKKCVHCKKQKDAKRVRDRTGRRKKFGVTPEAYFAWVEEVGGACEICKKVPEQPLAIDHCHETGTVRGLLCHQCNAAIGLFKEDPERMIAAIVYLKERG